MSSQAQKDANRRAFEAREKHWTLAPDGHSMFREYNGHELRVELEDGGYRLYVDGVRRGFYDHASGARAQGIWLAEHGVPGWVGSGFSNRKLGGPRDSAEEDPEP